MALRLSGRARMLLTLGVLATGLLAVGAEGLHDAATNRTPVDVTCAQLREAAPTAVWLRVSGCRVLYSSIGFIHRRSRWKRVLQPNEHGTVTEVIFPLVDSGDKSLVRLVVATNDATTIEEVTRALDSPPGGAGQAILALYDVAKPVESAPVVGMVRAGIFGGEGRDAVSKLGAPLAPDFQILDLGTSPSFARAGLVAGGGVVCALLFMLVLRAPKKQTGDAGTGAAAHAPAPGLATKAIGVSRLMLLNVPADAGTSDIEHAPALGTRHAVQSTISELLPGTTFDESGRGRFARADYAITFELGTADDVQTAIVGLQGQPAIVAIRRLLRKTGWRLFAPQQGAFVEAETLGGLMATAAAGTTPDALRVRTETRAPVTAWTRTSAAGSRYALLAIVLLAILGWAVWSSFASKRDEALASQDEVIRELIVMARANFALHVATGTFTAPEQLADPANAQRLGAAALPPLFATPLRHGYRFEIQGQPVEPGSDAIKMFEPAYSSFVYSAAPVDEASPARSFAFISDKTAVYSTMKGIPAASDQLVRAMQ